MYPAILRFACATEWSRDAKQLRTLKDAPTMSKVLDDKYWGLGLKFIIALVPVAFTFTIGAFIYIYSTLNQHAKILENISEWRRNHTDTSVTYIKKIDNLEVGLHNTQVEFAGLKADIRSVDDTARKTAAAISVVSDQINRLQQTSIENREKLVNLQVLIDDAKSK